MAVSTLAGTFSGEKLLFLYKEQLHLPASGLATLAILLAIPPYLRPNVWGLALTVPTALLIALLPAWTKSRQPLSEKPEKA